MTLHANMTMSALQPNPLKLCRIKYELEINVFLSLNCLFSIAGSLWKWLMPFLLIWNEKLKETEINIFLVRKPTSTFLISLKFQGYCCKSSLSTESKLKLHLHSPNYLMYLEALAYLIIYIYFNISIYFLFVLCIKSKIETIICLMI